MPSCGCGSSLPLDELWDLCSILALPIVPNMSTAGLHCAGLNLLPSLHVHVWLCARTQLGWMPVHKCAVENLQV